MLLVSVRDTDVEVEEVEVEDVAGFMLLFSFYILYIGLAAVFRVSSG